MKAALLTALLVFTPASISAASGNVRGFMNGNELYQECTGSSYILREHCIGYLEGVTDAEVTMREVIGTPPNCLPLGVDATQIRDVVVQYLEDHPAIRNDLASDLAATAMAVAWPCSAKSTMRQ